MMSVLPKLTCRICLASEYRDVEERMRKERVRTEFPLVLKRQACSQRPEDGCAELCDAEREPRCSAEDSWARRIETEVAH